MIFGYIVVSMMTTELHYIGIFYLMIFLSGAYGIVYNVQIMSQAEPDEIGEMSGMFGSLHSLTMVIGPLVAGMLLESTFNLHRGAVVCFIIGAIIILPHILNKNESV
jgi:MFS family permease